MLRWIFLVLFAVFCPLQNLVAGDELNLKQSDQQVHFVAGYALTFTGANIMKKKLGFVESLLYSTAGTIGIGAAKEYIVDKRPSRGDFWATTLGAGLGASFYVSTEFLFDW
jgi:hypothetical protein